MERKSYIRRRIERFLLVVAVGAVYSVARYSGSLSGQVAGLFMGVGVLVAAISWFQSRLEERERLEKLEFDELRKSATSSTLFNVSDSEVFPAQRSREQFEKYFVPAFTVIIFLVQFVGALMVLRSLQKLIFPAMHQPVVAMSLFGMFFLVLFVIGKYSTNLARLEGLRLLRPGASYMLLSAYLCLIVTASIAAAQFGYPRVDLYVARGLSVVLLVVGVETAVTLIFELYRPRVKGKVERPVYESRLVSLLCQPEGLITTMGQTLDYQFGFKVSETWFYRFFEKALLGLILLQLAVLLVSTCVVFIEAGEEGLLERYGKPVAGGTVLGPGAHFKLPWPIDKVYRFRTEQIQTFNIGFTPDPTKPVDKTVLWTASNNKEENFLVANRSEDRVEITDTNATAKRPPPVSLLTAGIPVQYQITNLVQWAYNNEDPDSLLQDIATREVVRYFVSVDLHEIMSKGRWDATTTLRDRIQAEVTNRQMGAQIVFVGLQDIHPPTKVAPDYEKVVAAIHTKQAAILNAQAEAIKTNALAGAQAFRILGEAQTDKRRRELDAQSRAAAFTNQIAAYKASPQIYKERAYLETFARAVTNARIYLLLTTNTQNIAILNLEDKLRPDLENAITVPPPKGK